MPLLVPVMSTDATVTSFAVGIAAWFRIEASFQGNSRILVK